MSTPNSPTIRTQQLLATFNRSVVACCWLACVVVTVLFNVATATEKTPQAEQQNGESVAQQPLPRIKPLTKGGVLFTFDDRNFSDWVKAIPFFEEFGVKATFFISGEINKEAIDAIEQLRAKGHAIGSHSVHHLRAVDYLEKKSKAEYLQNEISPQLQEFQQSNIAITSFAYPMSNNNAATDDALSKVFRHIRTGRGLKEGEKLSESDQFFVPVESIGQQFVLNGKGIDFAPGRPDRTFEQIEQAFRRAARNDEIIVLYAHQIAEDRKGNFITPAALARIFSLAKEQKLEFYTFDDLPIE